MKKYNKFSYLKRELFSRRRKRVTLEIYSLYDQCLFTWPWLYLNLSEILSTFYGTYIWVADSVFAFLPFVIVAVFWMNDSMNNSRDLADKIKDIMFFLN